MESVIYYSFGINLNVLRLLGLYPKKKHSDMYLTYGYIVLIVSLVPDPLFSLLYFLQVEETYVVDAGFNLFLLVAMICFIPKLTPFIKNNKRIRECIYNIEQLVNRNLKEKQQKIVDECVRICRRNSRFFFSCVAINCITWSSKPLFSSKRQLPMDVWLPFDPTINVGIFYFVYAIIAWGVLYSGLVSASIDPLIGGLSYHCAGQIMVLKDNLQNLSNYVEEELSQKKMGTSAKSDLIYNKIRECVNHHTKILIFVKEFEECFSWIVFTQFAGSMVIICFCCLQLSRTETDASSFFLMVIYLFSALLQIYFYCYYGTTLYEESNDITGAAYLGQWYEYDIKSRKALILLMEKANISMSVSSGKILDLSLDTFTMILRRAYSLLAVLKNYY